MNSSGERDGAQRRAVLQRLESLQRAGVRQLRRAAPSEVPATPGVSAAVPRSPDPMPRAPKSSASVPTPAAAAPSATPAKAPPTSTPIAAPVAAAAVAPAAAEPPDEGTRRSLALDALRTQVAACTRCSELACQRTQTVFGVGTQQPKLVFLGEAPGADEDARGEPFVGPAGQLLTDIIEKGMKLQRSDVYILNVLKCRPPGNRRPTPDETANCREYLDAQLKILAPQFLCCLGATAAQSLLRTDELIGKLRGRWFEYQGIRVIATYHPAYLLRNPSAKRDVWNDVQMLLREMTMPPPG